MSLAELAAKIRAQEISPVELTQDVLARIERFNPELNAFITITADAALAEARSAEAAIAYGNWRGPLHGIPLALKDLIDTAGVRTTAASAVLRDHVPTQDAEIVQRLKAAGAVLLGKQNLHEFAYGGSSMVSFYGPVRNAWNPAHIAGGSSGGSATAVAAGLGYGAIGTDTAGSIREPASLCGIVGLKPTYGRVSARGVVPLSISLDHVGPLARRVEDVAIILQAIAGYDGGDSASVEHAVPDYGAVLREEKSFRIGVPRKYFYEDLDPEVAAAMKQALRVLESLHFTLQEVELNVPTDRTLQSGESYRYHAERVRSSPELYQPETLRRIRSGENVSDADLTARRREQETSRREIAGIFQKVDLLVTPTTPIPAPLVADLETNPDQLRPRELVLLRNTRPFNVWGLPAISLPCGFTQAGLPLGLQIAGPHWEEGRVLRAGFAYEQATAWHKRVALPS